MEGGRVTTTDKAKLCDTVAIFSAIVWKSVGKDLDFLEDSKKPSFALQSHEASIINPNKFLYKFGHELEY